MREKAETKRLQKKNQAYFFAIFFLLLSFGLPLLPAFSSEAFASEAVVYASVSSSFGEHKKEIMQAEADPTVYNQLSSKYDPTSNLHEVDHGDFSLYDEPF